MISLNNIPQNSMDLIRLILIDQLGLKEDRVSIYDEKWKIPTDDDLFITIEYRNGKCISNRNTFIPNGDNAPDEEQNINMIEYITVGIFSKNRSSMQRKEEVLMAMMSSYAELLQEKYSFKIARIGTIDDLSVLEASAMLKRYDINLVVYAWYQKIIGAEYLTSPFNLKVIANDKGDGEITTQFTQTLTKPT